MHQIMHKIPEKEEGGRSWRTRESKEGREEDLKAGLSKRERGNMRVGDKQQRRNGKGEAVRGT